MTFNSPLRKNYFFAKDTSIITQRHEQSDSNSKSLSLSCDSMENKSPNNSLEKARKNKFHKKQQNQKQFSQRQNILHRNINSNTIKLRSQSINVFHLPNGLYKSQNQIRQKIENQATKKNKVQNYLKGLNANKSPAKLQKNGSQSSQISTQIPKSFNLLIDEQRPGFVRFSQQLIEKKQANVKKTKKEQKRSVSILKNSKNAFSCNKIDSNYLRFRDKTLVDKQKVFDSVRLKHQKTLRNLKTKATQRLGNTSYSYSQLVEQQKYKDELFPANFHSLFYSKFKLNDIKLKVEQKGFEFIEIAWKRISELFNQTKKLTLFNQNSSQKIIKNQFSIASNDFILAFNAIKNVNQFFKKIFEPGQDQYEKHGIYCLKIFQQNAWKTILIDDLIPVIVVKNKQTQQQVSSPLFSDINITQGSQQIEIWPFLLEKAYASYYNSYESLHQGVKIIDLLQEILMTPSQCYFFPDNEELSEQVVKKLQNTIHDFPNSETIIVGINMKTKQPCIIEKKNTLKPQQVVLKTLKSEKKIKIKHLFEIINTFYLFMPFHFKYFNASVVNFNKNKKQSIQNPMTKVKIRQQILFRTFNIDFEGPFSISFRQKQKRFYQRNLKKYEYLWNRVIIVKKQFGEDYRWIDGKYLNQKSVNFNFYLQKGQYGILIMPETISQENLLDMTMIVLSNSQIGVQKKVYEEKQKIIESACCDIAQRKGIFKQINQNTCSYSFIERSSAIIIENINNQKTSGQLVVTRSIAGLKAKVQIYPFNMDFCINEHESNVHKRKYKKVVEILIEKQSHFTVVLMMKGGIDYKFFKVFKFNN